MGVLLGEFPLKYEAFDNTVASGKNDKVLEKTLSCKLTARMIFMIFLAFNNVELTLKNSRSYKQAMTTLFFFVKITAASAPSAVH